METVAWVITYIWCIAAAVKIGCDLIDIIKDWRNNR